MERPSLKRQGKISIVLFIFEIFILTMYVVFIDYGDELLPVETSDPKHELGKDSIPINAFEDVHLMVFVGYGFLMIFLKRYGFSGLGFNFIIGTVAIQWSIVTEGFFKLKDSKLQLTGESIVKAEFATATVLVTLGVILGKVNPLQLIIITMAEVFMYSVNRCVCEHILEAVDPGGAIYVHLFGAVFGLGVARMIYSPRSVAHDDEVSSYHSDLFSMLGTLFLWVYWPGFNSSLLVGHIKHRAIINTYFALAASCVTAFACSAILTRDSKFSMVHIQNSTLAGGVAIGAISHMIIHPWGAILIGFLAGVFCTSGYEYFQPWLIRLLKAHDTCGVTSLHGIPGLLSAICSVIIAFVAGFSQYKHSLYQVYPARTPSRNTTEYAQLLFHYPNISPGQGRSAGVQGAVQLAASLITLAVSVAGGIITGFIARRKYFDPLDEERFYLDAPYWEVPDDYVGTTPQILISQGLSLTDDNISQVDKPDHYNVDKQEETVSLDESQN